MFCVFLLNADVMWMLKKVGIQLHMSLHAGALALDLVTDLWAWV